MLQGERPIGADALHVWEEPELLELDEQIAELKGQIAVLQKRRRQLLQRGRTRHYRYPTGDWVYLNDKR